MKNFSLSATSVFSLVLRGFNSVGDKITKAEKKLLSVKGIALFVSMIIILTMATSCDEKLKSPVTTSPAPYSTDTTSSAASNSSIYGSQVTGATEHMSNTYDSLKVKAEKAISVVKEEEAQPKTDAIILSSSTSVDSSYNEKIAKEKVINVISPAMKITKAAKASKNHDIKSSFRSTTTAAHSTKNTPRTYCPCEKEQVVSSPNQTLSYWSRQSGVSVKNLRFINKPQAFIDKGKTKLKKNIRICLKRSNC